MIVSIRPALRNDAPHIAALLDIAGHGIEWGFWAEHAGEEGAVLAAARRLIIEDVSLPYHLGRAHVLEEDGEVAGVLTGNLVEEGAELHSGFPDYIRPLLELEAQAVGFWVIVSLAVYPDFRGRGHARRLLAHAADVGRKTGARGLSLAVEDNNAAALSLYRGSGFEVRDRRDWRPYRDRSGPRHWLLMTRDFGGDDEGTA